MKKYVLLFTMLLAAMSTSLFAQQENPLHYYQLGMNFSSLNSFGMHFKTGNDKTLLRVSLLNVSLGLTSTQGRTSDSIDIKNITSGAGIRVGFEKHVALSGKVNFIWGFEAGANFSFQKQKQNMSGVYNDYETTTWNVAPMVDAVLGVTYTLSDHFVFGAEITPNVSYGIGKTKTTRNSQSTETNNYNFSCALNTNSAGLSIAYRFGK